MIKGRHLVLTAAPQTQFARAIDAIRAFERQLMTAQPSPATSGGRETDSKEGVE